MNAEGKNKLISGCVLLVDDEESYLRVLLRGLSAIAPDHTYLSASTAQEAILLAQDHEPEVGVVDLMIDPSRGVDSGLELIEKLLSQSPTMRIITLTGHGSDQMGIAALHRGASSFITKPVCREHLRALIQDAISHTQLKRRAQSLEEADPSSASSCMSIKSRSPAMLATLENALYAASTSQPVLILGETGTGKGVIAQAIHKASKRRDRHFIRCQPSFVANDLVSSELFGHCKGSFTGALTDRMGLIEEANRGTLFIDEVDELPHQTQISLLNVLQEKVFRRIGSNKEQRSDFRLISATNRPKESLIRDKLIREDFYHRIAHCTIEIPPLRDRKEDIELIAQDVIRRLENSDNLRVFGLSKSALAVLKNYNWPGNVRELISAVESAAFRADYKTHSFVEAEDLSLEIQNNKSIASSLSDGLSFRELVRKYEDTLVRQALTRQKNNQSLAAKSLKMDRASLRRILERDVTVQSPCTINSKKMWC